MQAWLVYSLFALFAWGLWGFLGKLGAKNLNDHNLLLHFMFGTILVYAIYIPTYWKYFNFEIQNKETYFAILGGALGSFGSIFFLLATSKGPAGKVIFITAMYPLVTALLSYFFLSEVFSFRKIVALVLALMAIILLAE